MPQYDSRKLRRVTTFPALVDYLRDDLDWPIDVEDAEELVFHYDPRELGIDPAHAAKIEAIYQIRPLATNQPWGVFFIEFESKKLPVVVLRRILRAFAVGKRSARPDQPVWHMDDLLFISAFGDAAADQREIAFAHFHQEAGDLPTLRVLGWDGSDTPLKLEHVHGMLRRHMRWPADPDDQEEWREAWAGSFRHRIGHVIRTADALATELAGLARGIRDAASLLLAHESANGPLRSLHKAFQTALIHDLSEADFADTYAQTITYGLLTAAISRTEESDGRYGTALVVDNLADIVPVTNPFLKEMLQEFLQAGGRTGGIDFDELGVQDVVELLRGDETDLPAILRDFGNRTQREDPVIHFYEHFLTAYDKKLKVQRGVFYTPQPVVSYIVRSVHALLQSEFGLADGLADTTTWGEMARRTPGLTIPAGTEPDSPFVVILDPATGTATFLVEVIDVIYKTLQEKWGRAGMSDVQRKAAWNDYVPAHLLPRLYGYELMMAPYAIAHMKLGLKLHETGYDFRSGERVRVYLTNSLEAADDQAVLEGILPALAHEARSVSQIKLKQRFVIVLGNPPYSILSANKNEFIDRLMADYKRAVSEEKNIQPLSDDYIKFIRLGQQLITEADIGVLALITNHTYLSGLIHRGMREELMRTFSHIRVIDLHGSALLGLTTPQGEQDKSVFDIRQGVAITVFSSSGKLGGARVIERHDLWGTREHKYGFLGRNGLGSTRFDELTPVSPHFFFANKDLEAASEYYLLPGLTEIFGRFTTGFVTGKDDQLVSFSRERILAVVTALSDPSILDSEIADTYGIGNTSGWPVSHRRQALTSAGLVEDCLRLVSYRPFDNRYTYYSDFLQRARLENMSHLCRPNLALVATRIVKGEEPNHFFVSRFPVEKIFLSPKTSNNAFIFPLYLYQDFKQSQKSLSFSDYNSTGKNLGHSFLDNLSAEYSLESLEFGVGDLQTTFGPEDVVHYIYAVFHDPKYRERYGGVLRIDFPRVPITSDPALFSQLAQFGADLVALHLHEDDYLAASWTKAGKPSPLETLDVAFVNGKGGREVGRFGKNNYRDGRVYLDAAVKAGGSYFDGVAEDVWEFMVGGYQVMYKWLYDRRATGKSPGRTLTDEDIRHYPRIAAALRETIRLMAEIDEVIEEHGGWPIQ